jgi:hypothetical protein
VYDNIQDAFTESNGSYAQSVTPIVIRWLDKMKSK